MAQFDDRKYLEICSERTLQTNKDGFFMTFVENVAETAGPTWIKNVFDKLRTDKERIRAVYELEPLKDIVTGVLGNVQEVYRKKCGKISKQRRLEAEKCFKGGDELKALVLYSQSVLKAPKRGEGLGPEDQNSLTLSLWGRSEVLMALKDFPHALADLQLALKEDLPNIFKAEAFLRMAICYRNLGEDNKSKVSVNLAQKFVSNEKQLVKLRKILNGPPEICTEIKKKIIPEISGGKHENFPQASSKIGVKESPQFGRYVVARKPVKTGDTLVVEPPYVACLLPEKFGTHCHNCFERLKSPIGCPDCSSVAFCSVDCRDSACFTYHKYECKFLDLLIGSGMSILSHTALRMITQNSLEKCRQLYRDKTGENVYTLCSNAAKREATDFLQRTLMAAFLLRCLQKSQYFEGTNTNDGVIPSGAEYEIGELLLLHLQILQFNAHEIYETVQPVDHRLLGSRPSYIGVAVYPTVALFNHGCYPGVTRHFVGKKIVINAVRPLETGCHIEENYGPVFTWRNLGERQRSLSGRYWFNCRCPACVENWPKLAELESVANRVRCPNGKCSYLFTLPVSSVELKCPTCNQLVSLAENIAALKWCEEQYDLGQTFIKSQETTKAIAILCPALDEFHRVSSPPHRQTHLIQETLRMCWADSGNAFQLPAVKNSK